MTVLVQDSFIDASLTSLASHTSNTGSGWALLAGGAALITPSGIGLGGSTSGSSIYAPTGGIVFDEGGYVEATFSTPASGTAGWRIGIGAIEDNGGATGERIGIDVNFASGTTQFRVVSGTGTYTYTVVDTVSGNPSPIASPFTIRVEPGKAIFNGTEYAIPDFPIGYRPYLISVGFSSTHTEKATISNYEAGFVPPGPAPYVNFWRDFVTSTETPE